MFCDDCQVMQISCIEYECGHEKWCDLLWKSARRITRNDVRDARKEPGFCSGWQRCPKMGWRGPLQIRPPTGGTSRIPAIRTSVTTRRHGAASDLCARKLFYPVRATELNRRNKVTSGRATGDHTLYNQQCFG